jgi:hypothetical protein
MVLHTHLADLLNLIDFHLLIYTAFLDSNVCTTDHDLINLLHVP